MSHYIIILYFQLLYPTFQVVLYFLQNTLVLSFYIDVVYAFFAFYPCAHQNMVHDLRIKFQHRYYNTKPEMKYEKSLRSQS